MNPKMTVASRITQLRNKLKLSQKEFAERVGITQGALSQLENQKSTLSLGTIINISKEFGIDCNWLIIGDGENFNKGQAQTLAQNNQRNANLIPLINEEAHAGYIKQCHDIDYISTLDVYRIPGFESGDYRMFEIEGDSMAPTIHPREIVVTQRVDNRKGLESGTLTVIITNDGIVAKRYYCHQDEPSNCILKSDNSDYKTYSLDSKDIKEMWEVKAKITNVLITDVPASQERFKSIESDIMALKMALKSQLEQINKG